MVPNICHVQFVYSQCKGYRVFRGATNWSFHWIVHYRSVIVMPLARGVQSWVTHLLIHCLARVSSYRLVGRLLLWYNAADVTYCRLLRHMLHRMRYFLLHKLMSPYKRRTYLLLVNNSTYSRSIEWERWVIYQFDTYTVVNGGVASHQVQIIICVTMSTVKLRGAQRPMSPCQIGYFVCGRRSSKTVF